ncbi:hypothetical protein SK066_22750 [Paenibacillus hunanensis]|uniref:phosphoribosyltransferase-like protein n=1 Tax=Paenibacillus hunanensis TaxID=539262 RepID=UPI002A6B070B|nr:hypothetical protein [Paenibacillus hunanensis]WPP41338.1 hypothetical protein SK066_22750 [Paenibacillus hunanensis]
MEKEQVIRDFLDRYGEDEYFLRDIKQKFTNWLSNVDDINVESTLIKLFSEFRFFSKLEIKLILKEQILMVFDSNNKKDLCIFPLKPNGIGSNSSDEMTMWVREIFREEEITTYKDTINTDLSRLGKDESIKTLVFFDDISGSGGTIVKFLEDKELNLKGKQIIINLIIITEEALEKINSYKSIQKDFDIKINYKYKVDKVFINNEKFDHNDFNAVFELEKEIWGEKHRNILGYEDSQLIIGFSHNIPNNTLSCFWYHIDFKGKKQNWNTLFKRSTQLRRKNSQNNFILNQNKSKG